MGSKRKKAGELTVSDEQRIKEKEGEVREEYLRIRAETREADRDLFAHGVEEAYKNAKESFPGKESIVWLNGPAEAWEYFTDVFSDEEFTADDFFHRAFFGVHDAEWMWYFRLNVEALDDPECKRLMGLDACVRSAGWWWPLNDRVVACERPSSIVYADGGSGDWLSSEDGKPAVSYRDGMNLYIRDRFILNPVVFEAPEEVTLEHIMSHPNVEARRLMIEQLGFDRFMAIADAKLIEVDNPSRPGGSMRALMSIKSVNGGTDRDKILVGCDGSTTRVWYMPVPSNCKTIDEAASAIAGIPDGLIDIES